MDEESKPTFWAMVEAEKSDAEIAVLQKHGLNWKTFIELEKEVANQVPVEGVIITEFGTIQRYEVAQYLHNKPKIIGTKPRIRLSRREQ